MRGCGQIWLQISAKTDDTLEVRPSLRWDAAKYKSWLLAVNSHHAALFTQIAEPQTS